MTVVAGAEALHRMLVEGGPRVAENAAAVMQHEDEADAITRDVMINVRSTFITPFDRGDIKALITSMDDAVDEMKKTAKTILLFEVTSFESNMVAMAEAIVQCAKLVARAMPLLSDIGRNAGQLTEICLQITQIEGRGDDLHDRGLKALYDRARTGNAMEFVRGQEIYDHLEQVIDSLDDVSDQIQAVIIEHA